MSSTSTTSFIKLIYDCSQYYENMKQMSIAYYFHIATTKKEKGKTYIWGISSNISCTSFVSKSSSTSEKVGINDWRGAVKKAGGGAVKEAGAAVLW